MAEPLTDEERKERAESIREVLEYFDPAISNLDSMDEPNLYAARIAARYEATLVEKDAQIEELTKALRAVEWIYPYHDTRRWCPRCHRYEEGGHDDTCQTTAAIKEATS